MLCLSFWHVCAVTEQKLPVFLFQVRFGHPSQVTNRSQTGLIADSFRSINRKLKNDATCHSSYLISSHSSPVFLLTQRESVPRSLLHQVDRFPLFVMQLFIPFPIFRSQKSFNSTPPPSPPPLRTRLRHYFQPPKKFFTISSIFQHSVVRTGNVVPVNTFKAFTSSSSRLIWGASSSVCWAFGYLAPSHWRLSAWTVVFFPLSAQLSLYSYSHTCCMLSHIGIQNKPNYVK